MNIVFEQYPPDIDELSIEDQIKWAKDTPYVISFCNNPSEELQLEAVRVNGFIIKYIKNPTENVKLEAIRCVPLCIIHIKHPSEQVILEALRYDQKVLQNIFDSDVTDDTQLKILDLDFEYFNDYILAYFSRDNEKYFNHEYRKLQLKHGIINNDKTSN